MDDNNKTNDCDVWGIVELMGHLTLAGRITKPGEYGGLWQIDIPEGESYRTEFFNGTAVYRIRVTSEDIARAYAKPSHEVIEYAAPIVTREEHERMMDRARSQVNELQYKVDQLSRKLLAVQGLPEKTYTDDEEDQ